MACKAGHDTCDQIRAAIDSLDFGGSAQICCQSLEFRALFRPETCLRTAMNSDGMVLIPGGVFRMGSDRHYPEEMPAHQVSVDMFRIDRHPVTNRQFRGVRPGDRPCHLRRDPAGPQGLSRRIAAHALCRLAGVFAAGSSGRSARLEPVVEVSEGRGLASSLWAQKQHQRARQSSGGPRRSMRRARLCGWRARTSRPRPNGNSPRAAV